MLINDLKAVVEPLSFSYLGQTAPDMATDVGPLTGCLRPALTGEMLRGLRDFFIPVKPAKGCYEVFIEARDRREPSRDWVIIGFRPCVQRAPPRCLLSLLMMRVLCSPLFKGPGRKVEYQ